MDDNKEYWRDLLGDDYSDELMDITGKPQRPSGDSVSPYQDGQNDYDDSARFIDAALGEPTGEDAAVPSEADEKADNFKVNFDFDEEYRDVPENRPLRQRRDKRTGCLGGVLYAVFVICVCLLLASLLWLAATDVLGLGADETTIQVTIPEDFTVNEVADILYRNELIKYKVLFRLYANYSDAEDKIKVGTYELKKNYDYRALVTGMTPGGGIRTEVDVVIPEGFTLRQIIKLFAANGVSSEEDLWDAAANHEFDYAFLDDATLGDKFRLEGYLFPDTYTFYVNDSPSRALGKMLSNFNSKLTDEDAERAEQMGYTLREIMTIASMIEKEAGSDAERELIASVIYNRLSSSEFPYLQIDATIYYGIAETGEEFSTAADTPYNSYTHEGLPPGPIANPGIASVNAALYPAETDYYYYALNQDKEHNFFTDYDAFIAFVNSDEYGG